MIETSNAQATSAPVSGKGSVARAAAKAGVTPADVANAVGVWQPGSKPDNLPQGAVVMVPGTTYQRQGGKNKGKAYVQGALVVSVPKVTDLEATGLSREAAIQKIATIGKAIKPAIMGRVSKAASSDAYIVRRYSENPKNGAISVSLNKLAITDKLSEIAATYGLTREEVAKRLGVTESVTVAA